MSNDIKDYGCTELSLRFDISIRITGWWWKLKEIIKILVIIDIEKNIFESINYLKELDVQEMKSTDSGIGVYYQDMINSKRFTSRERRDKSKIVAMSNLIKARSYSNLFILSWSKWDSCNQSRILWIKVIFCLQWEKCKSRSFYLFITLNWDWKMGRLMQFEF